MATLEQGQAVDRLHGAEASFRARALPVVFADFKAVMLRPSVPQDELLDCLTHWTAVARCVSQGAESEEQKIAVFKSTKRRIERYCASSAEHISQRQVCIYDTANTRRNGHREFLAPPAPYANIYDNPAGKTWDERRVLFEQAALSAFERCYEESEQPPPDEIIHVTCSGYASPSPAQVFLSNQHWCQTGVTHAYQMGCYGAFPAIRTACGLLAASYASLPMPKNRVDIVHTEYLSLHVDFLAHEPGNYVMNALFGDGFIKYSAYPLANFLASDKRGLKLLAIQERLVPNSLDEMTLKPGLYSFDETVSKNVPDIIYTHVKQFMVDLCLQAGIDFEAEKEELVYAIHPGGPAIVTKAREALDLDESKMWVSREILDQHGNMASATAPYMWQKIVETDAIPTGAKIVSVGFGPGLTVIGAVFEKV
ncbi:MAG TPA: 3-oxoacyl-[acyl-carrier-protein] synthase III C-terminal domain-containing protein [Candidatus Aquilonibacter sp.]|nr:3-oxoacyl-[acyl-carrier-protein] synthase III C-terminal domain-containing protein [Candidatus Aquilonibacter sp.]